MLSSCAAYEVLPAGAARADDSSSDVVVATIVSGDGQTATEEANLGILESSACAAYGATDMEENEANGHQVDVPLPAEISSTQGTWSLATVLGCLQSSSGPAPVPLSDVQGIVVDRADGSAENAQASLISPADLSTPSDFANTAETPVVSSLGTQMQYNRPARSGADADFSDQVGEPDGTAVSIEIYEGTSPLTVSITPPARSSVPAGSTVSFAAQVSGGQSALSYAWSFGGGAQPASTASPSVTFTTPGVYEIGLQASDANGDVGQAQPVTITVTGQTTATHTATTKQTTRPSGTGTRTTGPVTTTTRAGTGAASNTSTSTTHTSPSPATGTSGPSSGGGSSGGSGGSGQGAGASHPSGPPAPKPAAQHPHSTGTSPSRPASAKPSVSHAPTPPSRAPGARISGRLISTPVLTIPVAAAPTTVPRAGAGAGAIAPTGDGHPLGVALGIGAAVLLLGLGALTELRTP